MKPADAGREMLNRVYDFLLFDRSFPDEINWQARETVVAALRRCAAPVNRQMTIEERYGTITIE